MKLLTIANVVPLTLYRMKSYCLWVYISYLLRSKSFHMQKLYIYGHDNEPIYTLFPSFLYYMAAIETWYNVFTSWLQIYPQMLSNLKYIYLL